MLKYILEVRLFELDIQYLFYYLHRQVHEIVSGSLYIFVAYDQCTTPNAIIQLYSLSY